MIPARRIRNLGTETAFAVGARAAAFAAQGNEVFAFHLGDMNLPTPANVREAAVRAMNGGKTGYCPNAGIGELREALAADVGAARGLAYGPQNVAIQPGGKPVIGKFLLTFMNPGDEVLYPNPGYPIYESQIEFHGGVAVPYGFKPGADNFELDLEGLEAAVTPRTKILILNDLHNPTGAECTADELEALAELCVRHDLTVLADEAYFDIRYQGRSRSIASLPGMRGRTVILYTFSKKFAMTGWRLGAAIGPREAIEIITRLNVNDESCPNHFVQYAALEGLTGDQSGPKGLLDVLRERRDAAVNGLNAIEGVRCYRPNSTFYVYPDVTEAMRAKGFDAYDAFAEALLVNTGVSLCTRLHFGRPLGIEDRFHVRLAYSGIDKDRITEGLARAKAWLEA